MFPMISERLTWFPELKTIKTWRKSLKIHSDPDLGAPEAENPKSQYLNYFVSSRRALVIPRPAPAFRTLNNMYMNIFLTKNPPTPTRSSGVGQGEGGEQIPSKVDFRPKSIHFHHFASGQGPVPSIEKNVFSTKNVILS